MGTDLQHRKPLGPVDPRRFGQHERQAAERRDPHRGRPPRRQGRGIPHPGPGATLPAPLWRTVGGEPEELPRHQPRRSVRPGERERRRHRDDGGRCESARLHADRIFAGTSSERFPGRRQGARHRPGQRRQGDLPGRPGGGGKGARRKGHHRSHRGIYRRYGRPRAAASHRARHRRLLFRRAGGTGIARYAEVGAQRLQEDRGHAAAETAAGEAADDVGDLAYVSRHAQRGDRPAGRVVQQLSFGGASSSGHLRGEVRPGETTTIEPGVLKIQVSVHVHAAVVDSETGEKHGSFDNVSTSVTLMPGVYDLRFGKTEWRFIKVDGGKTTTLRPVAVILAPGLKWKTARVTTQDGKEVHRFDAVTYRAALPPGDYIVEVDGIKFPFPATEGEVFEVKPQ